LEGHNHVVSARVVALAVEIFLFNQSKGIRGWKVAYERLAVGPYANTIQSPDSILSAKMMNIVAPPVELGDLLGHVHTWRSKNLQLPF